MTVDSRLIHLLEQVFAIAREWSGDSRFDERKSDFVFHMTDWRADLDKLYEMYTNPGGWVPGSACECVVGFLYHAVPHLDAAAKLLAGTAGDPFSASKANGVEGQKGGSS